MQASGKINIFWFRRDLRLEDNHGLYKALSSGLPVLPVFIFDTHILDHLKSKTDLRVSFIYDQLLLLQNKLVESGSSLYIVHNTPVRAFQKLLTEFSVAEVYTNHDYEPYANERDEKIRKLLAHADIPFFTFKDQVIFERAEIIKKDLSPYTVFTPYSKTWLAEYHMVRDLHFDSENLSHHFLKTEPFYFPRLSEIGFEETDVTWPSSEINEKLIRHYDQTRNLPSLDGTSRMSVHLRFGTVSIRKLARAGWDLNRTWLNELIWRDFFMQILFHFPRVVTESFKLKYEAIAWRNDPNEFEAWCTGKTGYPLVDSGMRELNATGFMHNRVRMVTASFLTKHLLIDWRWGEGYFAEKLLDYELSSNNGNWQWAAGCGCDAAPYFRIFNPTEQASKFDPKQEYIRKWIPELDSTYIAPIVDHVFARKRALEVYKTAVNET
jgi:deoxyribodipyrimidine photo-lyase